MSARHLVEVDGQGEEVHARVVRSGILLLALAVLTACDDAPPDPPAPAPPAPAPPAPVPEAPPPPAPRVAPEGATCARDGVGADPEPLTPIAVAYTSMEENLVQEYGWLGERTAVLTPDTQRDACVMRRMVTVTDAVYGWYETTLGHRPELAFQIDGRATFTSVPHTCGAACGRFGHTGVEIQTEIFEQLYGGVRDANAFNHIVFYEGGRNFWIYGPKLDYAGEDDRGVVNTGFAVFMRFAAVDALGTNMLPWSDGVTWAAFHDEVVRMAGRYEADPTMTFDTTLRVAAAPANPLGLGATDLLASFLTRLVRVHGVEVIGQLFRAVAERPDRVTTQDAVDNLVVAASSASHANLARLFEERWRFPISDAARAELARIGPAVDPAPYGAGG